MSRFNIRSRATRISLAAVVGATSVFAASSAVAQTTLEAPPVYEQVGPLGVDVISGTAQISSPTITVGDPAAGGLSFSATWDTEEEAWRYSTLGRLTRTFTKDVGGVCYALYTVVYMGSSNVFQRSACTDLAPFGRIEGFGSLKEEADHTYTYVAADGSVARFPLLSPNPLTGSPIQSITKLNGEVITFSSGSIRNNYGYELRFTTSGSDQVVTAVNNTVCPVGGTCPAGTVWPSLTFSSSGNERWVTDSLGRRTRVILKARR